MSKQILLIVNPNAGKGKIQKKISKIQKSFMKHGYSVNIVTTQRNISIKDIIKKKGKIDIIICCGGDGTISNMISSVMEMEEKPKVSFIPLGTVNDFAKTIGLSRQMFYKKGILEEYTEKKTDIGKFNNKYFSYVVAFGAFTPVSYVTSQRLKKFFGKNAYFIVAIKYFFKIRTYKIKLEIEDEKIERECIYGSVSNSKSIGGFKLFRKMDISINDGKFEVLLINKPKYKIQYISIALDILFKRYQSKNFFYRQGSKIKINADKNLTWTIDGEYGGREKNIKIDNYKEAVTFVIPK